MGAKRPYELIDRTAGNADQNYKIILDKIGNADANSMSVSEFKTLLNIQNNLQTESYSDLYHNRKYYSGGYVNEEFPTLDMLEWSLSSIDGYDHIGMGSIPVYNPTTGVISLIFRAGYDHVGSVGSKFYISKSSDGGQTWSASIPLPGVTFNASYDYRNHDVICTSTGRLVIFYDVYYSSTHHGINHRYSDDDGDTWSAEVLYTPSGYEWMLSGINNSFVEIEDGTLFVPVTINPTGGGSGDRSMGLLKSTDNGVTWEFILGLNFPDYGGEPSLVNISESIFIMTLRNTNNIYQYITENAGVTWTLQGLCTFDTNTNPDSAYQMLPKMTTVNIFGIKVFVLYWLNREDGKYRRIFALPKDLMGTNGHLGWNISTLTEIQDLPGTSGNGCALHPNGNFRGICAFEEGLSGSAATMYIINTPNDIYDIAIKLGISANNPVLSDSQVPTFIPYWKGQLYLNTLTGDSYMAVDNVAVTDWKLQVAGDLLANTLLTNLQAYWKLDEGSGLQALDSHTNNYDSTANTSTSAAGKINTSFNFDRTQYTNFGNILDFEKTDSFSFSAWVKRTNTSYINTIFSKMDDAGNQDGYLIAIRDSGTGISPNKIMIILRNNTSGDNIMIFGSTSINSGSWYHIGITNDGSGNASGIKIYVNGQLDTNTNYADNLTGLITNTHDFVLGARIGSTTQYMEGEIDEVGVWNKVLTASDFSLLYSSGNGFPFSNFT